MTHEEAAAMWSQEFKRRKMLKEDVHRSEQKYTKVAHEYMTRKPYYLRGEEGCQKR